MRLLLLPGLTGIAGLLAVQREDFPQLLVPDWIDPEQYELQQYTARTGRKITINKEARHRFLDFVTSGQATWKANFCDLGGAITRMATLAPDGRINVETVRGEIKRLQAAWDAAPSNEEHRILCDAMGPDRLAAIDRFDRTQLADVLRVCRKSQTLSESGRKLFDVSRLQKKSSNDADRLRRHLARFGLQWSNVRGSRLVTWGRGSLDCGETVAATKGRRILSGIPLHVDIDSTAATSISQIEARAILRCLALSGLGAAHVQIVKILFDLPKRCSEGDCSVKRLCPLRESVGTFQHGPPILHGYATRL